MRLIPTLAAVGNLCIDVGANKGTWAYEMKRRVGPSGYVLAVEPQRKLVEYVRRGLGNFRGGVEVFHAAVSDVCGEAILRTPLLNGRPVRGHASLEHASSGEMLEQVPLVTLDTLTMHRKVHFIKIDVEGHEFEVVQGGEKTLRLSRPSLVIEMTDYRAASKSAQCFNFLTNELGYAAAFLDGSNLVPLDSWPPHRPMRTPNIVFVHESPRSLR